MASGGTTAILSPMRVKNLSLIIEENYLLVNYKVVG